MAAVSQIGTLDKIPVTFLKPGCPPDVLFAIAGGANDQSSTVVSSKNNDALIQYWHYLDMFKKKANIDLNALSSEKVAHLIGNRVKSLSSRKQLDRVKKVNSLPRDLIERFVLPDITSGKDHFTWAHLYDSTLVETLQGMEKGGLYANKKVPALRVSFLELILKH